MADPPEIFTNVFVIVAGSCLLTLFIAFTMAVIIEIIKMVREEKKK